MGVPSSESMPVRSLRALMYNMMMKLIMTIKTPIGMTTASMVAVDLEMAGFPRCVL